jgi:hypothetical protein
VTQRAQLFPAKGYLSSVEHPLTFGLGGASRVDEVRITWPSGKISEFRDLAPGRTYKIDESKGIAAASAETPNGAAVGDD